MKQLFTLTISLLFLNLVLFSQTVHQEPCYFDQYTNNESIYKAEKIIQKGIEYRKKSKVKAGVIKTIPVVIHVVHQGGTENISNAQIQSQIDIMNEDYGKIAGTNGDGNGVDTEVRFCLAKIDPNGNCTNGIVRINSSLTNHKPIERAMLKQLSFWDNKKYMNIYLVKSITGGILGYSSFPGGPDVEDGIVIRSNVFGNTGTAASSLGRTASHEIGHWFGLYHTFNNGCGIDLCSDGDLVCDTPPQNAPSYNCSTLNTCNNDVPDVNDQKENYMNYTPDACKSMFTAGQRDRLQATLDNLRTTIWSATNLAATGCDANYISPVSCPIKANLTTLTPSLCIGNSAYFMDITLNDATNWNWTFNGGNPSTSTTQNPTITYANTGTYDVKLVVSDGTTIDSITFTNYINVTLPSIGDSLSFGQKFDNGAFPPTSITIIDTDGLGGWQLDSMASTSGKYSLRVDNLNNPCCGSTDEIVLPSFDFTTIPTDSLILMTFKYAYARSDASFSDELVILVSTDCGVTFTQKMTKSGNSLVTGPTQTTAFIPDSTQWKEATVFLDTYQNETNVLIKMVNISDGGNNLYIDDIYVGDGSKAKPLPSSILELNTTNNWIKVFPNPTTDFINIEALVATKNIQLYNITGQLVKNINFENKNKIQLAIDDLNNGIYFLKGMNIKGQQQVQKILINK